MKRLIIAHVLSFVVFTSFGQARIGKTIDGEVAEGRSGYSVSLSADGNTVAIGAVGGDGNGEDAGHVRVYIWTGTHWMQKGLDIDGEAAGDYSGYSVSLSPDGNTLAIGAKGNDGNGEDAGHVRVFEWTGTAWMQKGMDIDGEAAGDWSGWSVSLSADGNTVAIGSHLSSESNSWEGHVEVYTWTGTSWVQKGVDIGVGEAANDRSGSSVSLSADGNLVAIGAFLHDGNGNDAGYVRVYRWTGTAWEQKGTNIDGAAAGDESGWSVNLSADGNTIAIGARGNDGNASEAGHVRIYRWDATDWTQKGADIDGETAGDESGWSVSLSADGNTVAIGAPAQINGMNAGGYIRIYKWTGTAWVQRGLKVGGNGIYSQNGWSVSLSADGNTIAVGAPFNSGNGLHSGQAYVYSMKGVWGFVYKDLNQNCQRDTLEFAIPGQRAIIQPGNLVAETTFRGQWHLPPYYLAGDYTITIDTSGYWTTDCPVTQSFTITDPDDFSDGPYFGMYSTTSCPKPNISLHMPSMRPCADKQKIYVQICNASMALGALEDVYVTVELDSLLSVDDSDRPYTDLGNNQYLFNMYTLYPRKCVNFWLETTLSCDAVLGQSLCINTELTPAPDCVLDDDPNPHPLTVSPCLTPWDNSSLDVEGFCQGDSIVFEITNTGDFGDGDMACFSPVTIYMDGNLVILDSIQLLGQETTDYRFPADGESWYLGVGQHPKHPGASQPNAAVENCGGMTMPSGINDLPHGDADPIVDVYCGIVTNSYGTNYKTGFPLGVGDENHVLPNQQIQYLIHFQNTGTDTAFTLVVRDTLDEDFNIFTVQPGVASHDYEFTMYGPRVLQWTFDDIMLPDSSTNEQGSQGFLTFTVHQIPNLPNGTELNNSAGIYFNFNEPIITNTTSHIVKDIVGTHSYTVIPVTSCDTFIEYEGVTYTQDSSLYDIANQTVTEVDINDIDNSLTANTYSLTANQTNASYQWFDCDNDNAPVPSATGQTLTPESSGNYAVEITMGGCVVTSDCQYIVSEGEGNPFQQSVHISPNPSTGIFTIQLNKTYQNVDIGWLDVTGKVLDKQAYANTSVIEYNCPFSSGVYFVRIRVSTGESGVFKVLKM